MNERVVRQVKPGYCAPAVLQFLLGELGYPVSQEEIVSIGGFSEIIQDVGISPKQLAEIVSKIDPRLVFWLKEGTGWRELEYIVNTLGLCVCLNIQGFFVPADLMTRGTVEEDNGHYVIVKGIFDDTVKIHDPSFDFPRFISRSVLELRWWDCDEKFNQRLMFVITHPDYTFPETLGMHRVHVTEGL